MSWKITPPYEQREPVEVKFSDFWVVRWKLTKFFMSYLTSQVFLLSLHHSSVSWEATVLYFFTWNFIYDLGKKSTEFHQMCTLICSFCWKYKKLQLKKYRGVMSYGTAERCEIWRKTNLLSQKKQKFGEFLIQTLQSSEKFALWLVPFMQCIKRLT